MNPVLRENVDVLFDQGHVLTIYFYLLILLAGVEFIALYSQSLGEQMWRGSGLLLKVSATAALVLIVYFALRLANQEYAPERFKPLKVWLHERRDAIGMVARGREASLFVHVLCLVLLSSPLLIWAAATSHTPPRSLIATLGLLAFYGLCYGVWGLVASVLWEGERESREFVVRLFTLIVIVGALVLYLPLNPAMYLLALLDGEAPAPVGVAGMIWSGDVLHFTFHLALGGFGLVAHRHVLKHVLEHEHG
jgi:hypothetical protein